MRLLKRQTPQQRRREPISRTSAFALAREQVREFVNAFDTWRKFQSCGSEAVGADVLVVTLLAPVTSLRRLTPEPDELSIPLHVQPVFVSLERAGAARVASCCLRTLSVRWLLRPGSLLPLTSCLWLRLRWLLLLPLRLRFPDLRWLVFFVLSSSSTESQRGHQEARAKVVAVSRMPEAFRISSSYRTTICHEGFTDSLPSAATVRRSAPRGL